MRKRLFGLFVLLSLVFSVNAMALTEINDAEEFNKKVLETKQTYLVDFYAPWCGACRMMAPVLKKFAEAQKDVLVAKVNTDNNDELSNKYKIQYLPTLILISEGKEVRRHVGMMSYEDLVKFVKGDRNQAQE